MQILKVLIVHELRCTKGYAPSHQRSSAPVTTHSTVYSNLPVCAAAAVWTVVLLTYANAALNPLIYTCFNADFRSEMRKLLRVVGVRCSAGQRRVSRPAPTTNNARHDQQASVSNLDCSSDILCARAAESTVLNGHSVVYSAQQPAPQPPSIVVHRAEIDMIKVCLLRLFRSVERAFPLFKAEASAQALCVHRGLGWTHIPSNA